MIIIETCPRCGHYLHDYTICTYPPIPVKKCLQCGWRWEGEPELVTSVPFSGNTYLTKTNTGYIEKRFVPIQPSDADYDGSPCEHCSNNPSNGGSGICNCILGQKTFY